MNDTINSPHDVQAEVWSITQQALYNLQSGPPTGDDSAYDYWPNALEATLRLYRSIYLDEGKPIKDYLIHHFEESCGHDLTVRFVAVMHKYGLEILTDSIADFKDSYTWLEVPDEMLRETEDNDN